MLFLLCREFRRRESSIRREQYTEEGTLASMKQTQIAKKAPENFRHLTALVTKHVRYIAALLQPGG
jgi:hypothetical protein